MTTSRRRRLVRIILVVGNDLVIEYRRSKTGKSSIFPGPAQQKLVSILHNSKLGGVMRSQRNVN